MTENRKKIPKGLNIGRKRFSSFDKLRMTWKMELVI